MGSGIDAALSDTPELKAALEDMRDQLLLVMLRRLGGKVKIPIAEIDQTGRFIMEMQLDEGRRAFTFTLRKKS